MYRGYIKNIDDTIEKILLKKVINESVLNEELLVNTELERLKDAEYKYKDSINIISKINLLIALLHGMKNEYISMQVYLLKSLEKINNRKDYSLLGKIYLQLAIVNLKLDNEEKYNLYYETFQEISKNYEYNLDIIIYLLDIIYIKSESKKDINEVIKLIEDVHRIINDTGNLRYKQTYYFVVAKVYLIFLDDSLMAKLNLLEALNIAQILRDYEISFLCEYRLGICEMNLNNFNESRRYYIECLYDKNYKDINVIYKYRAATNLVEVLINKHEYNNKEFEEIEKYKEKSIHYLNLIEEDNRHIEEFSLYLILAKCYLENDEVFFQQSIEYLNKARERIKYEDIKNRYPLAKVELISTETKVLYKFGQYTDTISKSQELIYEALKINNYTFIQCAYKMMFLAYEKLKEYKLSTIYFKLYSELKKQFIKNRDKNYLNSLHHRYEFIEEEISNIKKIKDNLSYEKYIDPLTKLYNRKYLDLIINNRDFKSYKSIYVVDIDYFKRYNDKNGHLKGDELLNKLSKLVNNYILKDMCAVRMGGEEFLILSNETNIEDAKTFGDNLCQEVKKALVEDVTISIGLYTNNIEDDLLESIDKADKALYDAKQQGRDRCICYNHLIEGDILEV